MNIVEKIYNSFLSLIRMVYYFGKPSQIVYKKGIEKEIYIFGNGPTLSEALKNIDFFQNKDVLAVNHFAQTEVYCIIKPVFYVLIDPAFFGKEIDHIHTERINKTIGMLVEKTNWKMCLFVSGDGLKSKSFVEKITENPHISLKPINATKIDGFASFRHWCYKHNLGIPSRQTVILPSIFCAINLGYKNIYLLGCENSWIKNFRVNDMNQLCIYDEHFYDNNSENLILVNEKDPYKFTIYSELLSSAKVFYAHKLLEEYSKYRGAKIWNATQGSFIDAYERCKIKFNQ